MNYFCKWKNDLFWTISFAMFMELERVSWNVTWKKGRNFVNELFSDVLRKLFSESSNMFRLKISTFLIHHWFHYLVNSTSYVLHNSSIAEKQSKENVKMKLWSRRKDCRDMYTLQRLKGLKVKLSNQYKVILW